jgi:hypothetical protein
MTKELFRFSSPSMSRYTRGGGGGGGVINRIDLFVFNDTTEPLNDPVKPIGARWRRRRRRRWTPHLFVFNDTIL